MTELADMAMTYDNRCEEIGNRLWALSQGTPPGQRGHDWIRRRRDLQGELKACLRWRSEVETSKQDDLRRAAIELSDDYPDLQDVMVWCDFAEEAMQKSKDRRQVEEDREEQARRDRASSQALSSDYAYGAHEKYGAFFAAASGRASHLGSVGAADKISTPLPSGWRAMSDTDWARDWLRLGGYRSPEQTDENGWTALHHATQATVFWDLAHRTCRGLIAMMRPYWLRAKTWGGRPKGYSALHMAANGSDIMLERGNLVRLLIDSDADLEAEDEQGRTPFLLACGTGVVDVAEALSQAGCSIHAVSWDGRNAADRCRGSSGSMRKFLCTNQNTVLFFR